MLSYKNLNELLRCKQWRHSFCLGAEVGLGNERLP